MSNNEDLKGKIVSLVDRAIDDLFMALDNLGADDKEVHSQLASYTTPWLSDAYQDWIDEEQSDERPSPSEATETPEPMPLPGPDAERAIRQALDSNEYYDGEGRLWRQAGVQWLHHVDEGQSLVLELGAMLDKIRTENGG